MKFGLTLRNMGPQSTPALVLACARAAEEAGVDDLWVADHLAIPPDDAEGSDGRYLEPLATLAWLAGATRRIGLGTGVLILPYRPPLLTAKWVATLQELSGERLLLGVGAGWMRAEFKVLGVDRKERGRLTDEALELLTHCFAADEVQQHGQPFLFRPRPARPPVYVGGAPPHALERAVRYAEGWMPMGGDPGELRPAVVELRQRAADAGRTPLEVVCITRLPLEEAQQADDRIHAFAEVGVTRLVHVARYDDADTYRRTAEAIGALALGGRFTRS